MINNSGLSTSLTSFRYALDQGAAAIAADIEGDEHPGISGEKITMKISPHQVQRRRVARLLEGEPTGNSLRSWYVSGLLNNLSYIYFFNAGDVYNLFAFPSECNFSGLRFDLDLVKIVKEDSSRTLGISSVCK